MIVHNILLTSYGGPPENLKIANSGSSLIGVLKMEM